MAKKIYVGVNNVARQVKKMYVGVNGVARKVKKIYVGVNGIARLCYSGTNKTTLTQNSGGTASIVATNYTYHTTSGSSTLTYHKPQVSYTITFDSYSVDAVTAKYVSKMPVIKVTYSENEGSSNSTDSITCDSYTIDLTNGTVSITFKGVSSKTGSLRSLARMSGTVTTEAEFEITCDI